MLRRSILAGLFWAFSLGAAPPPLLPGAGPVPPPTSPDSAHPDRKPVTDSVAARAATTPKSTLPAGPVQRAIPADSVLSAAPADSARTAPAADSVRSRRDSLPPVF